MLVSGLRIGLVSSLALLIGCGQRDPSIQEESDETGGVSTTGDDDRDDHDDDDDDGPGPLDLAPPTSPCPSACAQLYDECGLALPGDGEEVPRQACEDACEHHDAFGSGAQCIGELDTCRADAILGCWGHELDPRLLFELHDDPQWEANPIVDGLTHYRAYFDELFGDPQIVNLLAVDLDHPHVRIELTATDVWDLSRRPIPDLADHAGAIAAINGGFAPGGAFEEVGYGIMKFRGEIWPFVNDPSFHDSYEALGRNAVGIDGAGEWHVASRGEQGWELGATWPDDWPEVEDAMAGGSHLVEHGQVHPLVVPETTQGAYLESTVLSNLTFNRHPRTAIAIREDDVSYPGVPTVRRRVGVLAAISGRHEGHAAGMTLQEVGELMVTLGCRDALELDGGGSTTMWLRDGPGNGVVNYPTDNGEFDQEGLRSLRLAVLVMER
jgi:hypothetical protein